MAKHTPSEVKWLKGNFVSAYASGADSSVPQEHVPQ